MTADLVLRPTIRLREGESVTLSIEGGVVRIDRTARHRARTDAAAVDTTVACCQKFALDGRVLAFGIDCMVQDALDRVTRSVRDECRGGETGPEKAPGTRAVFHSPIERDGKMEFPITWEPDPCQTVGRPIEGAAQAIDTMAGDFLRGMGIDREEDET